MYEKGFFIIFTKTYLPSGEKEIDLYIFSSSHLEIFPFKLTFISLDLDNYHWRLLNQLVTKA